MKGLEVLVRGIRLLLAACQGCFNPYEGVRGFGAKLAEFVGLKADVSIPMKGLEVLARDPPYYSEGLPMFQSL